MKKIYALLVTLFAVSYIFAAASVVVSASSFDVNAKPNNIAVYKLGLGTGAGGGTDSLAIGADNVYGPFNLSIDPSRPQYKGFRIYSPLAAYASGDSLKIDYQLLPTNKISDTNSTWVAVTAVALTGVNSSYIDISALPGQSIVIKITNLDQTAVTFIKPLRIVFFESAAVAVDSKR